MSRIGRHRMIRGRNPEHGSEGFTLLEMLVVLAIASLLVGLVMPRLLDMPRRIEINQQRASLLSQIGNLGYQAYMQGRGFTLQPAATPGPDSPRLPLQIPPGWRIQTDKAVKYAFNGTCDGGRLMLTPPEGPLETYLLAPPACQPEPV